MYCHDDVLRDVRALAKKLDADAIAGAFVASLRVKPGFWRAPLIALAAARAVPGHALKQTFSDGSCKECGLHADVEVQEMHEGGQLSPGDIGGAVVALQRAKTEREVPKPSRDDVRCFTELLALVKDLPATAREGQLEKAVAGAKLVVGNKYDRRHVLETLAACGILETPEHHGFTTRWSSFAARQARPSGNVECDPPLAFWIAAHGINAANVRTWFGSLGVKTPAGTGAQTAVVAKQSANAAKRERRAARVTEFEVGDALTFADGKRWLAGIVTGLHRDRGGTIPIVELVDWTGTAPATRGDLAKRRAAGARRGSKTIRSRFMIGGLWVHADPRGRWSLAARGLAAPTAAHLDDPFAGSASVQGVEDLPRLAKGAVITAKK